MRKGCQLPSVLLIRPPHSIGDISQIQRGWVCSTDQRSRDISQLPAKALSSAGDCRAGEGTNPDGDKGQPLLSPSKFPPPRTRLRPSLKSGSWPELCVSPLWTSSHPRSSETPNNAYLLISSFLLYSLKQVPDTCVKVGGQSSGVSFSYHRVRSED